MGKPKNKPRTRPATTPNFDDACRLASPCGLPNPLHKHIEEFLKELAGVYSKMNAVSQSYDGPLYRQGTVTILLRAAAEFSIRRLKIEVKTSRHDRDELFYFMFRLTTMNNS